MTLGRVKAIDLAALGDNAAVKCCGNYGEMRGMCERRLRQLDQAILSELLGCDKVWWRISLKRQRVHEA